MSCPLRWAPLRKAAALLLSAPELDGALVKFERVIVLLDVLGGEGVNARVDLNLVLSASSRRCGDGDEDKENKITHDGGGSGGRTAPSSSRRLAVCAFPAFSGWFGDGAEDEEQSRSLPA